MIDEKNEKKELIVHDYTEKNSSLYYQQITKCNFVWGLQDSL